MEVEFAESFQFTSSLKSKHWLVIRSFSLHIFTTKSSLSGFFSFVKLKTFISHPSFVSLSLSPLYDFQIRQLFDLVVGSGIGGVVALIVSVRDYSPNKLLEFFLDYPQKVFKANIFTKIGFWIRYKYENKHLIAAAKELFGEDCSLNNLTGPECALVRVFCQFIW